MKRYYRENIGYSTKTPHQAIKSLAQKHDWKTMFPTLFLHELKPSDAGNRLHLCHGLCNLIHSCHSILDYVFFSNEA